MLLHIECVVTFIFHTLGHLELNSMFLMVVHLMLVIDSFFFGTRTAVGQGLPVPTGEVSLAFSD